MCRHLCGLLTPPSEPELAEAFATSAPKRFEFWSGDVAMVNLTEFEAEPADHMTVRYPFRCTFAPERPAEVSYGERDYSATVMLNGFRLEDWNRTLTSETLPDRRYLHTPDRLDEYLTVASVSVARLWPQIERADTDLLERVAEVAGDLPRHERLDEAKLSFAAKDFDRVIELLEPLEDNLFQSDAKRLTKARKRAHKKTGR